MKEQGNDVNGATDFVDQYEGAGQRRDLIPYLFNIFIEDFLYYITQENLHAPVIGKMTVSGLLLAVDLKIALFTVSNLQKAINRVAKHCVDWNWNFNSCKNKILMRKKGDKSKKSERWTVNYQTIDVAD